MTKILLDCDTGIDDAMLLLHLAAAIKAGEAELVAVGTVHGNIDAPTGALNTLRVLELAGVDGIPVAVGAARPLAQEVHYALDVHGTDGLGDVGLPAPKARPLADVSAAEQIVRLARRHPGELTLLAVGPLTNLAVALLLEPRLPELVREVVVMGGAFDHPGNITTHAEANIWHDPEAADLVLGAGWPLVLVPLDATHPTAVDGAWLDRLPEGGEVARLAAKMLDFYVAIYTPILGYRGCVIHDPLAAMVAVDPGLGRYVERPVRVELRGEHTRGTTLWDARPVPGEVARRPVKVVADSDVKAFRDRLLAAVLAH